MSSTPSTAPSSPFFKPGTPSVTVVQQTPGGTRRQVRQNKQEVKEHKSSILGCTANLVNAIVGSGIVGIPFAIKEAGFGAGIFLVILCAILTEKSLRLLIATAKHVDVPSYETVAEASFGIMGFRFVACNMFVMAYGAMASYLMVVKQVFSTVLGIDPEDAAKRRAVLLVVSLSIMVPLSSKRDMADLAFTSRLSVIIDTILVGLVVYNAPMAASLELEGGWEGMASHAAHWDTLFVGLGVLSFAFVCQHSAFIIAGSLERPTIARWSIVTRNALCVCVVLALACGICGYTGYLEETEGNILNNLDPKSWSANTARAMLGTTMLFVFPLESFVARHVCVVLLFAGRRAHEGEDASVLNRRDRRIGLTVLLYLTAVIPAALFDDLGSILAITGAIGGSCLSYIGPGAVFLGVHGERFMELLRQSWLGKLLPENQVNAILNDTKGVSENTPLLQKSVDAEKGLAKSETNEGETQHSEESALSSILRVPVWYLTGMPIWCAIARQGIRSVHKHAQDMALKSPHPIRIGSVMYRRKLRTEGSSAGAKTTIERIDSLPLPGSERGGAVTGSERLVRPGMAPPKSPGSNINQMLGKAILESQREAKNAPQSSETGGAEDDPQAQPPTWYDFYVAFFFIMFGCLALVAGLVSLAHGK